MRHREITYLLIALMLLLGKGTEAQDTTSSTEQQYLIPGIRFNYGNILAHTPELKEASVSNPYGIQVDIGWHFNTQKAFDYCQCLPRLGASLYYWNYQNDSVLGSAISLIGFAEPFFNIHRKVNFSIRPGFGVAYTSNPYDSVSNPYNLAYSTYLGFSLLLNATIYWRISDHIAFNAAINYNHISNGGTKQPNKGLNYPTLSAGLDYSIQPLKFNRYNSKYSPENMRRNGLGVYTFVGIKGSLVDNKSHPVYGFIAKYFRLVGRRSNITAGMEMNIDQTKVVASKYYESTSPNARYIAGITGGYEHGLGRFGLLFDIGVYLHNPEHESEPIYQRYGARYRFIRNGSIGINLRAHRHRAEFFEFRIGYLILNPG